MEAKINLETETSKKSLDIYIYDVVTDYEYDFENDEFKVAEASARHVREMLSENEDAENINIFINSVGGSIYEGLAIYNQLKRSKAYKTVHIDGFACSIASVIACAGDKIIMPKASMMMIHNAWTVAVGNAKELRKAADDLDVMSDTIAQAYMEKSGGKIEEIKLRKLMANETYLPAETCFEYGLCDEIAENSANSAEKAVAEMKNTASMLANMKVCGKNATLTAENEVKSDEEEPTEPETDNPVEEKEPVTDDSAEPTGEEPVNDDPKDSEPLDKDEITVTFMKLFTRKVEK